MEGDVYFTDGPSVYKKKNGQLVILWSSWGENGYTVGQTVSESGNIQGPWTHVDKPGFLYQIGSNYYYLGKWICKKCTDQDATDCVTMYQMCRTGGEEPETRTYFQKIRAFSDFALEVPYNPAKIADDMNMILESLSEKETTGLLEQIAHLEEDVTKY